MCVSSLSGELLEVSNVLGNIRPLHTALFKGNSSLLLLVGILELGFEFIEELGPDDREVIVDSVKSINPYSHVSDSSCDFISFDKGEGESNLLDWQVESSNIFIDTEVCFDFFDEVICFGSITSKFVGEVSHHFNVCCSWYSSLALPCRCRLARRWSTSSTTASTSSSTASSTPRVSTVESNVELVEDFGRCVSTSSSGLSSRTTFGTGG